MRLLPCVILTLLWGCNEQPKESQIHFRQEKGKALGTTYSIQYEVSHKDISYLNEIEKVFDTVNRSMSTYLSDSDISRINRGDDTVIVDNYFLEVFKKSEEVWEVSDGRFDPTVGALVNAWGFGPEKGLERLDRHQVDSILLFTGLQKVRLTPDHRIVKTHPNVYLDFNALAKGYTVDLVARLLDRKGVKNYLIEIGGELLAKGEHPKKKRPWTVDIDSPEQTAEKRQRIETIHLKDRALATSGNYRKFRIDSKTGERYVHTIDPRTGYPVRSTVLSVSVLAPICMEADAYATTFMTMTPEQSKVVLSHMPQLDAFIISAGSDGAYSIFMTEGFKKVVRQK